MTVTDRTSAPPSVGISRRHRDALRDAAIADLSDLGRLEMLVRADRMAEALDQRDRFMGAIRLLDDLGWHQADERTRFELTMPPAEATAVLRHLDRVAHERLRDRVAGFDAFSDPEMSAPEIVATGHTVRAQVDAALDTIAACDAALFSLTELDQDQGSLRSAAA
jgi:hypothetical protein